MATTTATVIDIARCHAWFAARGWQPHAFQTEIWQAMAGGDSGLLHATTGSGKTYAVWMGALLRQRPGAGLQVLWLTPMRALATPAAPSAPNRTAPGRRRWSPRPNP
jgi:ATP-dependent Lhr-like helicase